MKPDRENEVASGRRRRVDRRAMARISPLPPPEEIFSDWLVSVPKEDSLEAAARFQIELIDRSAAASHPDVQHLRMLFVAFCGDSAWKGPISNL